MGRPPCCDKSNVKKGLWTVEEDAKILAHVSSHGIGNWTLVPKKAGLNRCGKSCRLRWTNYLRPDLKHDGFTPQEEDLIIDLHQAIGSRWSLIAKRLPGRTDNDVKNYWNTKLRKKLQEMGIDPITHKPVAQVITDFGNVGSLPNAMNRIRSLNNNSTPLMPKPLIRSMYPNPNHNNNNIMQHFFSHDVTLSTCSSSASSPLSSPPSHPLWQQQQQQPSYPMQVTPTSDPFSWSEFLLCDPLFSVELQQVQNEQDQLQRLPPVTNNNSPAFAQNHEGMHHNYGGGLQLQGSKHGEASCSSTSSFVDAILDRDSEIRSQFPNLAGACFDY